MPKSIQENVEITLLPFHAAIVSIGNEDTYKRVCNNVASFLGRQKITEDLGDWTCNASCKLTAKDKHTVQLPMNDARSILVRFAMQLNQLSKAGEFTVNASLPKACIAWIEKTTTDHELKVADNK